MPDLQEVHRHEEELQSLHADVDHSFVLDGAGSDSTDDEERRERARWATITDADILYDLNLFEKLMTTQRQLPTSSRRLSD